MGPDFWKLPTYAGIGIGLATRADLKVVVVKVCCPSKAAA